MLQSSLRSSSVVAQALGRRNASGIALKYSNALYSAAISKSPQVLSKVHTELSNISTQLKTTPELNTFVNNPTLSLNDRTKGIQVLLGKVEGSGAKKEPVSDVTKNLLSVLSENGRLGEVQSVIEGFNEQYAKYKGELTVVITSATPLARDVLSKLEATLKQSQAALQSKSLKVTNKVNPAVLGGFVVDFGDKTIDLSVSSTVNKLNGILQQSV
ncbi:OSCP, subunit 5 of the stator stalk of mitochondrial F1F0 ATP synthase [Athelia psychrophila]|uniref:ATP synthase subunit 5, mitochondrial n=1 Tax=Athelia psychrophila TaxID=1759441 RepID=A0A166XAK0_9AGAM|nr:OSCP, subunit 5 of the stator stalk of mitochondrial F1F0 ATP synthase [Fibularhizoctonia sp. CBS 109695]